MKILAIDQSLSKCAITRHEDGKFVIEKLSKTGKSSVKNKRKDTNYYDTLHEQIHHICEDVLSEVKTFKPDYIVFEALSFGSVGNASRDLACLYGAIRERLICEFPDMEVSEFAPTSLKSFAHNYLPEHSKWDGTTKANKPKKVKMDKKKVVEAVREIHGQDFLSSYNYSTGLDDLADSVFLGMMLYDQKKKETS